MDDKGLELLEKEGNFTKLFFDIIPYDNLMKSSLFAGLLVEHYYNWEKYDNVITDIGKNLNSEDSFLDLLDRFIDLGDYEHFFRLFKKLSSKKQVLYFKNNSGNLFLINDCYLFKGMKKEVYELYKDKIDLSTWVFTDYDLYYLLENKNNYSQVQLEVILKNNDNILSIANSIYLDKLYLMIIKLGNSILNQIYMSEEFLSLLRKSKKLDKLYKVLNELEVDCTSLLLNVDCLIDIGVEVEKNYMINRISNYNGLPKCDSSGKYFYFLLYVSKLKDKEVLFRILDFYLTSENYLSTFCILRQELKEEVLQEYLSNRKELINKIVQENKDINLALILGGLPNNLRKNEFFKERENLVIYYDKHEYFSLFLDDFEGKYRLNEEVLNDDRFIGKFIDYDYKPDKLLRLVCDNEELIKKLCTKVKIYEDMKSKIMSSLNDSKDEFETYIKILINSDVDVFGIEFLKDMIDVVFFNTKIKEVFSKYKGINLEKIKLEILSNVIKSSRESIASSITNPLLKDISYVEYTLNGEKVLIPTIIYDGEAYTFLVRRMSTGAHLANEKHTYRMEYFSTITEKNRSMFNGDTGLKCGYININANDILYVNSFDSISQRNTSNKYIGAYLKYPEWVSLEELNRRTLVSGSYNEIRMNGIYNPDFVVSYDEPNEVTLKYSHENSTPMVKILRKSYPNAIEQCEDPYSHWQ